MKITAVTQDQLIIIDGVPALMQEVGGYMMERGEWAVHFNTDLGIGEIEYLDARPNETLSQAKFDTSYSWMLSEHQRYLDYVEQQNEIPVEPDGADTSGGGSV